MRWLRISAELLVVSVAGAPLLAQNAILAPALALERPKESIVDSLEFIGLRYISPAAVRAQLSLHPGDRFDLGKLRNDLRTLSRLGWFAAVRVEELPRSTPDSETSPPQEHATVLFHFDEEPFLSRVEYAGSRLLSQNQIEKLLEQKKLAPGLGKPADPAALHRMALAVRTTLNELGQPEASVQIHRQMQANSTLNVRFEIVDGPHLPVRQVRFEGNPGVSEKLLRAQMQNIAPWKPLASLRSKNAYTQSAFEEDRRRIFDYFQNHGYPEARVGDAHVAGIQDRPRNWFPFPHHRARLGLLVTIPVQAGPFYRLESIEANQALEQAIENHSGKLRFPTVDREHAFSQGEVDKLRRFCSAGLRSRDAKSGSFQTIDAHPIFDPEKHSVRLKLNLSDSPPYLVHRIEFQGLHKFNDRFVRRRIPLGEGYPLDDHALEVGLTKLARTGYFKPIRRENIQIQLDDGRHTADISIRLEEIGQQRVTFDGGRAQFGSTLGIAYTVFDLLDHEEMLTTKLEGGPESLQLLLGIAKEGIFGTRGSLAFAIFDNAIRPWLARRRTRPRSLDRSSNAFRCIRPLPLLRRRKPPYCCQRGVSNTASKRRHGRGLLRSRLRLASSPLAWPNQAQSARCDQRDPPRFNGPRVRVDHPRHSGSVSLLLCAQCASPRPRDSSLRQIAVASTQSPGSFWLGAGLAVLSAGSSPLFGVACSGLPRCTTLAAS